MEKPKQTFFCQSNSTNYGAGEDSWECKEIKLVKFSPKGLNSHWKNRYWSWSSNTLATWCKEPTRWKRPWCWERLRAGGEGSGRGWDGWMVSLTQWTWFWASSRRWRRTGKPDVLQSMESQRVRPDWATEQQTRAHSWALEEVPFPATKLCYWAQYPWDKLTSCLMRALGSRVLVVLLTIEVKVGLHQL